jgi:hypothetical protein
MNWPFGFYARETVAHLRSEVTFWRTAWEVERQRANLATDRLLNARDVMGITAPLIPDRVVPPSKEDEQDSRELAMAGDVGEFGG